MAKSISSVSPKGQITIPMEIRDEFDIAPRDRVVFEVVDGVIQITPLRQRLLKHHQRYTSHLGPLDWKSIESIAHEEAAENVLNEGTSRDPVVDDQ
jgi:AbrB family looped-hinge helix DNA binding protein